MFIHSDVRIMQFRSVRSFGVTYYTPYEIFATFFYMWASDILILLDTRVCYVLKY